MTMMVSNTTKPLQEDGLTQLQPVDHDEVAGFQAAATGVAIKV